MNILRLIKRTNCPSVANIKINKNSVRNELYTPFLYPILIPNTSYVFYLIFFVRGPRGSQNCKKLYLKIISIRVCKKIFLIKAKKIFCTGCPKSAVKIFIFDLRISSEMNSTHFDTQIIILFVWGPRTLKIFFISKNYFN